MGIIHLKIMSILFIPPSQQIVRSSPLFANLSDAQIKEVSQSLTKRVFPKKKHVFHQDDPDKLIYFIESGFVKIQTEYNEKTMILRVLGRNEMFGLLPIFDVLFQKTTVTAIEDTTVYAIEHTQFLHWFHTWRDLSLNVLQVTADILRQANQSVIDSIVLNSSQQIAKVLLSLADSCGRLVGETIHISSLTQIELSQIVGLNRVSTNKILCHFNESGWIDHRRQLIVIRNRDALQNLIGE